jgi:hypothetical protein
MRCVVRRCDHRESYEDVDGYPTPVLEGPRGDADLVVPSLRAVTVEERLG